MPSVTDKLLRFAEAPYLIITRNNSARAAWQRYCSHDEYLARNGSAGAAPSHSNRSAGASLSRCLSQVQRTTRATALLLGMLLSAGGCADSAAFRLEQPFAPPSQRVLDLDADAAYLSESDGRRMLLAEFPLPGSFAGPRAFVLFIEAPRGNESLQIGSGANAVRGFLIQEIGALAGKSALQSGTFTCRPVFMSENTHDVSIDATCVDGTRIRGTLTTRISTARIRQFRTQYAGDIAALNASLTTQPAAGETDDAVIETQMRAATKNSQSN